MGSLFEETLNNEDWDEKEVYDYDFMFNVSFGMAGNDDGAWRSSESSLHESGLDKMYTTAEPERHHMYR